MLSWNQSLLIIQISQTPTCYINVYFLWILPPYSANVVWTCTVSYACGILAIKLSQSEVSSLKHIGIGLSLYVYLWTPLCVVEPPQSTRTITEDMTWVGHWTHITYVPIIRKHTKQYKHLQLYTEHTLNLKLISIEYDVTSFEWSLQLLFLQNGLNHVQ